MITKLALHVTECGNKNCKLQTCYNMLPGGFCFFNIPFPFDIFFSIKYARAVGSFLDHLLTSQAHCLHPERNPTPLLYPGFDVSGCS